MYYIEAVNSFPEIKDKIEYIDKAIAIYPNDYSLYRKKRRQMCIRDRLRTVKVGVSNLPNVLLSLSFNIKASAFA